jgi:uncharacterized membrane protein/nitrite reductase/ring-hydroxylating ferredoxin subunit
MADTKDVLEGKPVRSPLHPALVHLPIALFPISLLFDAATWLVDGGDVWLVRAAFWTLVAGVVTGLVAAAVGMVDYTDIRDDHPAKKTATAHLVLNVVALAVFALGAGLRYGSLDLMARTPGLPLVASLVGLALVTYSGYLGGHLVYSDGVGVGRHRRRTKLPESTLRVPLTGAEEISVAEDSALPEGGTLRVEVGGVALAVTRVQGVPYAFQDFCTHRYAPLSEGALRDCEIVCPWHNSRFDVRTGAVMHGPAKVPLRTVRVVARDGKLWIARRDVEPTAPA